MQYLKGLFGELRAKPALEQAIRRAARMTAKHYAWPQIMHQLLLPRLRLLAGVSLPQRPRDALVSGG